MSNRLVPRVLLTIGLSALSTMASSAGEPAMRPDAQAMAGRYYLQGVREVGAELQLRADGRFDFGMAYGGGDQSAQGRWSVKGRVVTLISDPTPAAGFSLLASNPTLLDAYGTEPGKPTLLVVKVSTPRLALSWSQMEITAEFSNGQQRSGVTGRTGMLGFLDRAEPEWKGAIVKRVSVSYPKAKIGPTWFKIDSDATKSIEVNFEPGPMAPPAFERAELVRQGDADTQALVQQSAQGPGNVGWRFARQ
jgi:hypothetical protein